MKLAAEWITGFVDGEGCFHVAINRNKEMTIGYQVLPEFTVVQHKRDVDILYALKKFFGTGVVRKNNGDRMAFRVRNRKDLKDHIVPFFKKYPLQSVKKNDYEIFCQVLNMMDEGVHLTLQGLERIKLVAKRMNRGRLR